MCYLGSERRIRAATVADLRAGVPWLEPFLGELGDLRAALLLGRSAARGWAALGASPVPAVPAPHPSPANLAARPHAREEIVAALHEARRLAGA